MARSRAGDFAPLALDRPEDLLALIERRAAEMGARLAVHKGAERLSYVDALADRAGELTR